jgi:hypothetical protein
MTGGGMVNHDRKWNKKSGFEESIPSGNKAWRCDMGFGSGDFTCYARGCKVASTHTFQCKTKTSKRGNYNVVACPPGYKMTGCGMNNHLRKWNKLAMFEETRPKNGQCVCDSGNGKGENTCYARCCALRKHPSRVRVKYKTGYTRNSAPQSFHGIVPTSTTTYPEIELPSKKRGNNFAAEFKGNVIIKKAGSYEFFTKSDDGSFLFINDKRVVSNDGLHGMRERSGSINLPKGLASIRATFFNNKGHAGLVVSYSGPGIKKQVIPASVFAPAPRNCETGEYFSNGKCLQCARGTYSGNGATHCSPCWHRATPGQLSTMHNAHDERYQYLYANRHGWVVSPATSYKWNWKKYHPINGIYQYAEGPKRGSFGCMKTQEKGKAGIGCSTGKKSKSQKVLIRHKSNGVGGIATVSTAGALGPKGTKAVIYIRRVLPSEHNSHEAIHAIPWIASGVCFKGPEVDPSWKTDGV